MQRILQQSIEGNSERIALLKKIDTIIAILKPHLPPSLIESIARPEIREVNNKHLISWFTNLEGQPIHLSNAEEHKTAISESKTLFAQHLLKIETLRQELLSKRAISEEHNTLLIQFIDALQSQNRQYYLVNNSPVLVGWGLDDKKVDVPSVAPAVATGAAAVAASKWRHLCCILLPLLLLALFLLWWFFLRPQPSVETPVEPVKVEEPVVEKTQPIEEPKAKAEPAPPQEEPTVAQESKPIEPVKTCRKIEKPADAPQMAIIFNNASAMQYTLLESASKIYDFDQRRFKQFVPDSEIKYMYRKPNRSTASKQVISPLLDTIPKEIDIGLVELKSCLTRSTKKSAATNHGIFSASQRNILKNKINKMNVRQHQVSGTPIYEGLEKALTLVDGKERDALIVLITEGNGDCTHRNVCELIQNVAQERPKLKVNIVNINSPLNTTDCLAHATGGEIIDYEMTSLEKLTEGINQAMKPIQEEICE